MTRALALIVGTHLVVAGAGLAAAGAMAPDPDRPSQAPGPCVTIGSPKPSLSFLYSYRDTVSGVSEYTNQWKQFSATGSELVTTRTKPTTGQSTYVSQHQIVDDAFVLLGSTAIGKDAGGQFRNTMTYKPGATGDPALKACAGKTWTFGSVAATSDSLQGKFSTQTDPGEMKIISINEVITTAAGKFDTVRYTKTMKSPRGTMFDEIWKSIEHGVTVRRVFKQPGASGEETLVGIK